MAVATSSRKSTAWRVDPTAPWRNVDWMLILGMLALTGIGAAMIYSTTKGAKGSPDTSYLAKTLLFFLVGSVLLVLTTLVDYRRILDRVVLLYPATLAVLAGVLVLGQNRKGAQAWFVIGPFQLQPSEPAKLVTILTLASYLAAHRGDLSPRRIAVALLLAGIPMGLILMQPDLGTMLVFVAITIGMLVVAGVRARSLVVLVLAGLVLTVGVLKSDVLQDYQRARLLVFLSEDDVPDGARADAYNLQQSKIAIGLGRVTGWGFGKGPQTQNNYVPEQQTDFIFTAVAEELGFLGGATVLALFAFVTIRILRAAQMARDDTGTLICSGVLVFLAFHLFQNVGMCMGIMPITGIPLPFLSYGGSALLTTYVAMGLVLNVHMRRFR